MLDHEQIAADPTRLLLRQHVDDMRGVAAGPEGLPDVKDARLVG